MDGCLIVRHSPGWFLLAVIILGWLAGPAAGQNGYPGLDDAAWERVELAPGIVWQYAAFDRLNGAPQYINLLVMQADTAARRIRFAAADNQEGESGDETRFLTPSAFAEHYLALSVVNGGFFSDHPDEINSGIFKWQGTVWPFTREEPEELRFVGSSAFGLDTEGNWIFMNREGNVWADDWPEAVSAIAGAHRLIDDGTIPEPVKSGRWRSSREIRHSGLRHPRTAVCLTGDRYMILLVADGRHREAVGFNLTELARLMHHLGCADAINLDGGGSSTMFIRDRGVVNHPSDNRMLDREGERPVRTAIVIEGRE
jgi:exopolysaccharide biosynthesis protein